MFKSLKREMQFISENIAVIALASFLCATGGVMLWINGGSSWYIIRTSGGSSPQMSLIFAAWIIAYALIGAAAAMIWLVYHSGRCDFHKVIPWFCMAVVSYLFMLVWYAVFFCTRLVIFSAIILMISCAADILLLLFMRRKSLMFSLIMAILVVLQGYFIWFTFAIS